MHTLFKLFVWMFAAIGALAVASFIIPHFIGGGFVSSLPSPGGKFKALKFVNAGGGGLSPFCLDEIEIAPADAANTSKPGNLVFSVDCQSLNELAWTSPRELKVSFFLDSSYPVQVRMRKQDASGQVEISYEVRR